MKKKLMSIYRPTVSLSNLKNVKEALPFNRLRTLLKAIPFCTVFILLSAMLSFAAPRIFYTDVLSGPNTGGENNQGVYLSIFGVNFGTNTGSADVEINDGGGGWESVAVIKQWHASNASNAYHNGREDVGIITVQLGSGISTGGAIRVTDSNGNTSNTDHTFTVISGDIFFVDNESGSGSTCSYESPCATIQDTYHDKIDDGDALVVRGTNTNYREGTDGQGGCSSVYLCVDDGGTASSPVTIMGYPGEKPTLTINKSYFTWRINADYVVICGLSWEETTPTDGDQDALHFQSGADYFRFVNNDLKGFRPWQFGSINVNSGDGSKILGNYIHDDGQMTPSDHNNAHMIYYTDGANANDVEIAYNHLSEHVGGRGIQLKNSENFNIHHNLIHDIAMDGIMIATGQGGPLLIWNNILYNVNENGGSTRGGIRAENEVRISDVEIYNNTFYNIGGHAINGGWQNTMTATISNNIFYTNNYTTEAGNFSGTNNFFYSGGSAPGWASNSYTTNPGLADPINGDFSLSEGANAINAGVTLGDVPNDYVGVTRPQSSIYDVGAYEYTGEYTGDDGVPTPPPPGSPNPPQNLRISNQ